VLALCYFPSIYKLLGGKSNPYSALYAMIGPLLAVAVSGNLVFSIGSALQHSSESLGVKRTTNALTFPLALLMGRIGTAFIASFHLLPYFFHSRAIIPILVN